MTITDVLNLFLGSLISVDEARQLLAKIDEDFHDVFENDAPQPKGDA